MRSTVGGALILAACAVLACATAARAADAPDVLGLWKSNGDMVAARYGQGPFFDPRKPTLYKNESVISYRIDVQEGRAFAGVVIGTEGKEAPLTGVFYPDGKTFMFSDAVGSGMGSVENGVMQTCLADTLPNYVSTACGTFKR